MVNRIKYLSYSQACLETIMLAMLGISRLTAHPVWQNALSEEKAGIFLFVSKL